MESLTISVGKHRADTKWQVKHTDWESFVKRCRKVRRTHETTKAYDEMDKAERAKIKDGPSFVGGLLRGERRLKANVDSRSMITLDADYASESFLFDVELILGGCAYIIYSTHSHREDRPKYRLVVPGDREMAPDEYSAAARKLAEQIGMDNFDHTTFDLHRLMYFPSCSADAEPVFEEGKGSPLIIDDLLGAYTDWRDISSWPRHPKEAKAPTTAGTKAQDPQEKAGIIGMFCRAYSIEEGIETFLDDVYEPGSMENRYTYLPGSSANGLEIYPSQELAYSHQDSDPVADGRTYNLFDLVRVHKFGHLDISASEKIPDSKKPSFAAMSAFAAQQPAVKRQAVVGATSEWEDDDFDPAAASYDGGVSYEGEPEDPDAWMDELDINEKTGKPTATSNNAELLLTHGIWRGVLAYDAFGNAEVIRKAPPWRRRERPWKDYEPWLGSDDKRLLHWFSKEHGIKAQAIVQNAFTEVIHRNKFHPIKEYIEATKWDGVPRAESIFIKWLGAEDCRYVRVVTRKMLLAAVTRIYQPGAKFDYMLVLVGGQGLGKSTLIAKLGRDWFSDSLRSFDGKEAGEHLQNGWIFEIGELSALKRAEVEEVKAFLSKTEDRYRVAYDRQVSEFPRKCVFFGTTNTPEFLRDMTGNRRFFPVEAKGVEPGHEHWDAENGLHDEEVAQVWAEVLTWYKSGETLTIPGDIRGEVEQRQAAHLERDPREPFILEWLDGEDVDDNDIPTGDKRTRVCVAQVWSECLNMPREKLTRYEAQVIHGILSNAPDWERREGKAKMKQYGTQVVYERKSCRYPMNDHRQPSATSATLPS